MFNKAIQQKIKKFSPFRTIVILTLLVLTVLFNDSAPSAVADYSIGTTYTRFPVSTEQGLTPDVGAFDGEMEDYALTVAAPTASYACSGAASYEFVQDLVNNNVASTGQVFGVEGTLFGGAVKVDFQIENRPGNDDARFLANPSAGESGWTDASVYAPAAIQNEPAFAAQQGPQRPVGARNRATITFTEVATGLPVQLTDVVIYIADVDKGQFDFGPYATANGLTGISKNSGDAEFLVDTVALTVNTGTPSQAGSPDYVAPVNTLTSSGYGSVVLQGTYSQIEWDYHLLHDSQEVHHVQFSATCSIPDFGDAPDSYLTTLASDGPRHLLSNPADNPVRMGAGVTAETDANTPLDGTGDANDDGVLMLTSENWSDGTGNIQVNIVDNGATDGTCLNVWLDWTADGTNPSATGDGDFLDSNEHVVANEYRAAGTHNLSFSLPSDAADDADWYLRARLVDDSNDDGICDANDYAGGAASPSGSESSGEVEDYLINFRPTAVSLNSISAVTSSVSLAIIFALTLGILLAVMVTAVYSRRRNIH